MAQNTEGSASGIPLLCDRAKRAYVGAGARGPVGPRAVEVLGRPMGRAAQRLRVDGVEGDPQPPEAVVGVRLPLLQLHGGVGGAEGVPRDGLAADGADGQVVVIRILLLRGRADGAQGGGLGCVRPGERGRRVWVRLAAGLRQVRRDQMGLGPTGYDTGRSWFLLSSGCDRSGYCRVAHGARLIPNNTQYHCRTLVACLVWVVWRGSGVRLLGR